MLINKEIMSLRKTSTAVSFSAMLLILSLLLQCAVCTVTAALNANTTKTDSIVNGTHFDNRTQSAAASKSVTNAKTAVKPTVTGVVNSPAKSLPKEPVKPKNNNSSKSVTNAKTAVKPTVTGVVNSPAKSLPKEPVKPKNNNASKSVTNATTAVKPTATGVVNSPAKSLPKEPVKPKNNNNAKPVKPFFTLSKVNNASKNNQSSKIYKDKKANENELLKSNVTSKALNIKGAAAGTGVAKINQTSPISKINAKTTTAKLVHPIQKTTAYPILDEAESMFWNSEDDIPGDAPDTNLAVNAPATTKEGMWPSLMDFPEPIDTPQDLSLELLLWADQYGSGDTTEVTEPTSTATTTVPTTTTTTVPTTTTTTVPTTTTTTVPTTTTTTVPTTKTTTVPTTKTTTVPTTKTITVPTTKTTTVPTTKTTTVLTTKATTVLTTTTVMMTTTGLTATVPPTYENVDPHFGMNFDLNIRVVYDEDLEDPTTAKYQALEIEVEDVINKAFEGCWGFIQDSARVLDFYNATWRGQITKGHNPGGYSYYSPELLAEEELDSTGVNYNVTFETAKVFEHPDWVFDFISQNVTWNLEDSTIANSSVSAGDMIQDAQEQIKDLTYAPCEVLACPSCYQCSDNETPLGNDTTNTAQCGFLCKSATEQCSIVDNSNGAWTGECTCKKGYLPIGGDCVEEDVVIGVSVGLALAFCLILALLIVIIIRCCKDKKKDNKVSDSEAPVDALEDAPMPGDSKDESFAEEIAIPSAPSLDVPTEVEAEIENPREEERSEEDGEELISNFQPNLSNVSDEDLSRNYAIARARVASSSLGDSQDYLNGNSFF